MPMSPDVEPQFLTQDIVRTTTVIPLSGEQKIIYTEDLNNLLDVWYTLHDPRRVLPPLLQYARIYLPVPQDACEPLPVLHALIGTQEAVARFSEYVPDGQLYELDRPFTGTYIRQPPLSIRRPPQVSRQVAIFPY